MQPICTLIRRNPKIADDEPLARWRVFILSHAIKPRVKHIKTRFKRASLAFKRQTCCGVLVQIACNLPSTTPDFDRAVFGKVAFFPRRNGLRERAV